MIKVTERKNYAALALLETTLEAALAAAAEAGAKALDGNLAAGARSGVHYPGMPRRSSARGEYSQEQTGNLRSMVGTARVSSREYVFGLFPRSVADAQQAMAQEYSPVSGRANVRRTANDVATRRGMEQAAANAARR